MVFWPRKLLRGGDAGVFIIGKVFYPAKVEKKSKKWPIFIRPGSMLCLEDANYMIAESSGTQSNRLADTVLGAAADLFADV